MALVVAAAVSCSIEPEVRAQTLLVVDTDLPVARAPGQVPVAAMDTLRIDILDGTTIRETRELVLGDPLDWPVSLGARGPARLRLRLFRAAVATVSEAGGAGVLEPRPSVTIDRLVEVGSPADGVDRRRVLLTGDCLGFAADVAGGTTCIGPDERAGAPAAGLGPDDGAPSRVGTWSRLTPVPCSAPVDAERPCVPGSFDVIGDLALTGNPNAMEAPVPLRAVVVSPFLMDRTEVTVGRARLLLAGGWTPKKSALPRIAVSGSPLLGFCTFAGESNKSADARPLNCVTVAFARELCAASNGRLPTEVEWEHAARRGDGRPFPWGFVEPTCCTTSAGRIAPTDANVGCAPALGPPEPVGSHAVDCPGGGSGDVSVDGILDLGGSLVELTSDHFARVVECAPLGLAIDPTCTHANGHVVTKSTDWTAGLGTTRAAFRSPATAGEDSGANALEGFRCVYPEAAP
jgi:formylglycine-generating enzyme required for sulfatase activity